MTKTAEKQVEEITTAAEKTLEQGVEKMARSLENVTVFGQENMEAVVASSKIAAKAAESLNAEIIAYTKKSYEDGIAAARKLSECKSVGEYLEAQTAVTKSAIEAFVSEASRMNDICTAAAKEAVEPLSARVSAAFEAAKDFRA